MAWVIYIGMQDLHPESESWLAEWGRALDLSSAMNAFEEDETANLVTLLPQGELEAYEALSLWLQQHPAIGCTLVYPQPTASIGQRLQQGGELEVACQDWQQQAQALLTLFRHHRRQVRLFTWPADATTPAIGESDQILLPKRPASHDIEPVYSLLARQALMQDADLLQAVRFLAASTHNDAQPQEAESSLGAILERHRQEQQQQCRDQQAQAEVLQVLRDERDRALHHNENLQQTLDVLEQQAKEQREQLVALQANNDQAQSLRQQREEESVRLLEQLHSVQEELEQALLNRQSLESQLRDTQTAQGELEQRLKQAQSQFKTEEGKRTGLEQERDQLLSEQGRLNTQRKESEEENTLLLEQLHSVQEELEQALLNRQSLEGQLRDTQTAQGELEQRLKQAQSQFKAEEGKRTGLEQERDQLLSEQGRLNARRKESEEENALLLEQLHGVQEELERHILEGRAQTSQHTEQKAALIEQNSALQLQIGEQNKAYQQQELFLHWLLAYATRLNCAFYKKRPNLLKEHKALLASSASFDADWYTLTYPDVAASGIEPEIHYLKFGVLEGRNPCACFDTRHYITAHTDITEAGEHPLLHYIRWGKEEQRQVMPQQLTEEAQ